MILVKVRRVRKVWMKRRICWGGVDWSVSLGAWSSPGFVIGFLVGFRLGGFGWKFRGRRVGRVGVCLVGVLRCWIQVGVLWGW